jgi:SpoVK/Ycf46/Vps4 family AAA+-type ATPase
MDGIGNYNGMILVATTNNKDKLDPALYRELRLTPMYFTFLRNIDAIEIIEKFFDFKLNEEQMKLLPEDELRRYKTNMIKLEMDGGFIKQAPIEYED